MNGQDEWRRRIYNNRDLTKGGGGTEKEKGRKKERKTIVVLRTPEKLSP